VNSRRNFAEIGLFVSGFLIIITGCASAPRHADDPTLTIRWQRLVDGQGDTCGRCGETEKSIEEARRLLTASLKPLGIRVRVIKTQLTAAEFKLDPSESNRIWLGEETLETILGAKTGASTCAGVCGGSSCRTTVVDGQSYETIPPQLIVRAGLRVAADLVHPAASPSACCPSDGPASKDDGVDLQPMPWMSR
jgi:hypothetical protein